jgi:ribonuclease HII
MLFLFDDQFYAEGINSLCGVDEAGRGPLAGPVVAAAVVLGRGVRLEGIRDSKELTPQKRENFYTMILANAVAWGVSVVDHDVIDRINIFQASLLAMEQSVRGLGLTCDLVLVDGRHELCGDIPCIALVGGDRRSARIAAASIIAKVTRDRIMVGYHGSYPHYNFARNKGYGTAEHLAALRRYGPCPIHRKTFSGVREMIDETG